jgi:hypothetical protein
MSPEAQQIAIAGACGWTQVEKRYHHVAGGSWITGIPPEGATLTDAPDYLGSLDAIHEAEKVLTNGNTHRFTLELEAILDDDHTDPSAAAAFDWHATAAQRAEAFLRTLNLWTV